MSDHKSGALPALVAPNSAVSRRRLFAGAGTVGALAAVASALPLATSAPPAPVAAAAPSPEPSGGYQLSEHVQRYYRTARL